MACQPEPVPQFVRDPSVYWMTTWSTNCWSSWVKASAPNVSVLPSFRRLVTSQAEYSVIDDWIGDGTGPTPMTLPLTDSRNTHWCAGAVDAAAAYTVAASTGLLATLSVPRRKAQPLFFPFTGLDQIALADHPDRAVPNSAGAAHGPGFPCASNVRTVHQYRLAAVKAGPL